MAGELICFLLAGVEAVALPLHLDGHRIDCVNEWREC